MTCGGFNSKSDNLIQPGKNPSYSSLMGPLLNIGGTMAAGMLFFGFIGAKLDRRYDTGNMYLIIGLFIGLFIGFYETWRAVLMLNRQSSSKKITAESNSEKQKKENKSIEDDFNI